MAYKNLVNQLCADKTEVFCRMRDFICKRNGTYADYSTDGIGWTLWDAVYAVDEDNPQLGDYFVMFSAGESGDEDLYIYVEWYSGDLKIRGYQSWDPSTHTGSARYYSNAANLFLEETVTAIYFNIYGDLDWLMPHYKNASLDHRSCFFGAVDCAVEEVNRDVATCSSALTAGSDVSITVDSVPSDWEVGSELFIRTTHTDNMATVEMEYITIKTLVGNTITADLTKNYTADSKLCVFVAYLSPTSINCITGYNVLFTPSGGVNQALTPYISSLPVAYITPSNWEGKYMITDILAIGVDGWPVCRLPHVKNIGNIAAPMIDEDIIEESDGTIWRVKQFYSGKRLVIREV